MGRVPIITQGGEKVREETVKNQTTMTPIEELHVNMVFKLAKSGKEIEKGMALYSQYNMMHAALGIAAEAGEVAGCIKKHLAYGLDLDMENLIEEMGDLEFFQEHLRQTLGISRDSILQANMEKLEKRYPGFNYSDQRAQERADKL